MAGVVNAMTQDDRDNYRVARALAVARILRRLGWVSFAIGVLGFVGVIVLLVVGEMDLEQALFAAVGTVLVSLMSGASAYGSGMNLTISAARLDRDIARSAPSARSPETHDAPQAPTSGAQIA